MRPKIETDLMLPASDWSLKRVTLTSLKKINPLSSENLWSFIAGNGLYSGIRVTFREMHVHSRSLSSMRKKQMEHLIAGITTVPYSPEILWEHLKPCQLR